VLERGVRGERGRDGFALVEPRVDISGGRGGSGIGRGEGILSGSRRGLGRRGSRRLVTRRSRGCHLDREGNEDAKGTEIEVKEEES
jgi:hypothetical protein